MRTIKSKNYWETYISVVQTIFWIVLIISALYFLFFHLFPTWAEAGCDQAWGRSGLDSQWKTFTGCMIEAKPGVWIPEDNYYWVAS